MENLPNDGRLMYKSIFAAALLLISTNCNAQSEAIDFFLAVQPANSIASEDPVGLDLANEAMYTMDTTPRTVIRKFETSAVSICTINGVKYHIADYSDTTRVVTALDGDLRGYQGVSVGGVKTAESIKVNWFNDHFTHTYVSGKITSYDNRQVIEHY